MTKQNASAQELLKMKQELDKKAADVQKLEGQRETYYSQLKKEFDCDNMEQGENRFDEMKAEIEKKQKERDDGIERLKMDYEWGELR